MAPNSKYTQGSDVQGGPLLQLDSLFVVKGSSALGELFLIRQEQICPACGKKTYPR